MYQSGLPFAIVLLLWFFSCTPSGGQEQATASGFPKFTGVHCGDPLLLDVSDEEGRSLGYLEVINDSSRLWVSFAPAQGAELKEAALFVGKAQDLPRSSEGNLKPEAFPLQKKDFFMDQRWHCALDLDQLQDCLVLSTRFGIAGAPWADDPKTVYSGSARSSQVRLKSVFEYCLRRCGELSLCAEMDDASRQTLGPKEWANEAEPRLRSRFPSLFPKGMALGCELKTKLAGVEEVVQALLGEDRLLSELLALRLTLALGAVEEAGPGLEAMEVNRGPFSGWSIEDLVEETESVLGGCISNYSADQMAEVLSMINRNALPGQPDQGALTCPAK